MRKGELKYIVILIGFLLVYLLYQFIGEKPFDWTVTLYSEDTDPFGTFVLNESLPDMFDTVKMSNQTIYELEDSSYQNLFILAQSFFPGEEDMDVLLAHAEEGRNIFISADYFYIEFSDSLGFEISDYQIDAPMFQENESDFDSIRLMMSERYADEKNYEYPSDNVYSQFDIYDSTKAEVIAINDADNPVFIRIPYGEGNIYLNSTPLAFSNHFMLKDNNYEMAAKMLSFLPREEILWTQYYQVGRVDSQSPLRYILSTEGLKWAYYLTIAGLILFLFFEAKRRQRIIPVIRPLRNTTLDFVRTISNLYYQQKDHKNIAEKRISFFLDTLRREYFLPDYLQGKQLYTQVAAKSGNTLEQVEHLFQSMMRIRQKESITEEELKDLNTQIENFTL